MTCEAWDVVAVPFPFTDKAAQKRRPALVVSRKSFNRHGHTLMAMITTSSRPWPGDSPLKDLDSAGLSTACLVPRKEVTKFNHNSREHLIGEAFYLYLVSRAPRLLESV